MALTAPSYLHPRWYLPSAELTAMMGLMIDLAIVLLQITCSSKLPVSSCIKLTGPLNRIITKYFVLGSSSLPFLNHYNY